MNCSGETDGITQRLRNVCSDPDLRFEISTPLSTATTFHPSLADVQLSPLLGSDADSSSWMQFSLAWNTYLLNESSLIDLQPLPSMQTRPPNHGQERERERTCLPGSAAIRRRTSAPHFRGDVPLMQG